MSDTFRFSVPDRPAGTPVTTDEAERALRARVSDAPEGSAEHRSALWQLMRFLGFEGRHQEGQARYAEAARSFIQAIHNEARDPRALRHLEGLVKEHPEIAAEIPDIAEQMERCSQAVAAVGRMLREQQPPEASQAERKPKR